jgi:CNT family concentrative nucleoside transporter
MVPDGLASRVTRSSMGRFTGLLGIAAILLVAWLFRITSARSNCGLSLGLGLQFAFAVLVLKTDFGKLFQALSVGVTAMLGYSEAGQRVCVSAIRWAEIQHRWERSSLSGAADHHLHRLVFFDSLLPRNHAVVVKVFAIGMQKVMGASGAESLNVAASIFMGQTEAPLTIRPFLAGLTQSELFTIMVSGMAHVSGAVMAAYVKFAHVEIQHLLTAVIMTAPATIMLAKIFEPEVGTPVTAGKVEVKLEKTAVNVIDAAAQGAGDGLHLVPEYRGHADRVSRADRHGERDLRLGAWIRLAGSPACSRSCSAWFSLRWRGCWA